jgi:hypothetical protein
VLGVAAEHVDSPASVARLHDDGWLEVDRGERVTNARRSRMREPGRQEAAGGFELVVRSEQRPGRVQDPHAQQPQVGHAAESRLESVDRGQHVEPKERHVAASELADCAIGVEHDGIEAERPPRVRKFRARALAAVRDDRDPGSVHRHARIVAPKPP